VHTSGGADSTPRGGLIILRCLRSIDRHHHLLVAVAATVNVAIATAVPWSPSRSHISCCRGRRFRYQPVDRCRDWSPPSLINLAGISSSHVAGLHLDRFHHGIMSCGLSSLLRSLASFYFIVLLCYYGITYSLVLPAR
jgi:hypothetical protein